MSRITALAVIAWAGVGQNQFLMVPIRIEASLGRKATAAEQDYMGDWNDHVLPGQEKRLALAHQSRQWQNHRRRFRRFFVAAGC
jgi:hypothetical protein